MGTLIGALVLIAIVIFVVVAIVPPGVWPVLGITLTISFFVGLYFLITRSIFGSRWYENLRYKWTVANERRQQAREQAHTAAKLEQQLDTWAKSPLPTPDQFATEIKIEQPLRLETRLLVEYFQKKIYETAAFNKSEISPERGQHLYRRIVEASIAGTKAFVERLPKPLKNAEQPSLFTTTYLPTEDDFKPAYTALADPFRDEEFRRAGLFTGTIPPFPAGRPDRSDFEDDENPRRARLDYDRAEKEYDKACQAQWDAQSPMQQAFWGTPFYKYADRFKLQPTEMPFNIPQGQRFAGTWVVAPPGRGKTNLLHNMIAADRQEKCTIVLMDSKGDLINGYKGVEGAIVIDPATANINPLQLGSSTRSVEFLEYIFSALLDTSMTALQKTLFRSVLSLLLHVPNATLETFREVLTHGWKQYEQYVTECDPSTRDFFLAKEFDSPTYKETKQQVLWRLRLILSNEYLRNIFTAPTTNVPFGALLDSGKLIIIDNSKDDLGEEGAEFFGRFFVALLWMAAVSRSRLRAEEKMPVYCYIDECHSVIKRDEKIATILDECRSQKIALILAHQRIAQIVSPNVLDALGNCAIRMANSDDDAAQLAPRFRVEATVLRQPVGKFVCFIRDRGTTVINVPPFDASILPPPQEDAPSPPPVTNSPKYEPAPESPPQREPPPNPQPRKKGR